MFIYIPLNILHPHISGKHFNFDYGMFCVFVMKDFRNKSHCGWLILQIVHMHYLNVLLCNVSRLVLESHKLFTTVFHIGSCNIFLDYENEAKFCLTTNTPRNPKTPGNITLHVIPVFKLLKILRWYFF